MTAVTALTIGEVRGVIWQQCVVHHPGLPQVLVWLLAVAGALRHNADALAGVDQDAVLLGDAEFRAGTPAMPRGGRRAAERG